MEVDLELTTGFTAETARKVSEGNYGRVFQEDFNICVSAIRAAANRSRFECIFRFSYPHIDAHYDLLFLPCEHDKFLLIKEKFEKLGYTFTLDDADGWKTYVCSWKADG